MPVLIKSCISLQFVTNSCNPCLPPLMLSQCCHNPNCRAEMANPVLSHCSHSRAISAACFRSHHPSPCRTTWHPHCRDKDQAALKITTLADDTLPVHFRRKKKKKKTAVSHSSLLRPPKILVKLDGTERVLSQNKPSLLGKLW